MVQKISSLPVDTEKIEGLQAGSGEIPQNSKVVAEKKRKKDKGGDSKINTKIKQSKPKRFDPLTHFPAAL